MTRSRIIISAAVLGLLLVTLAACGSSDTANNPLPTGTPNMAQTQPTDTAMALATSTPANLQAAATVTSVLPTDTTTTGAATPMAVSPTNTPNYPPEADAAVAAAKTHLGKMVGIPADQISVVEVSSQVWTENGLGCPASMGMAKLNIPGYRIILKIKKATFEYHTNQDASIVRPCTNGTGSTSSGGGSGAGSGTDAGPGAGSAPPTTVAGNTGGGMTQDQITEAAKQDLAARLGVSEAGINVKSVAATQWRNSGLGCGTGIFLEVITPGYLIILTTNSSDYEYHTDMNGRLVLCINGAPTK